MVRLCAKWEMYDTYDAANPTETEDSKRIPYSNI